MIPQTPIDIRQLRQKIDGLDTALVAVLAQRMALVPSVAEYKKANSIERVQHTREAEVIATRRALAEQFSVNPDLIEAIMWRIIEDAHRIEKEIIGA